ncbi:hypothetical protein [Geoalkalibacter halelectricus]|uniref:hypothetical protein n=1 Tax=Geoalkalibacter halelectricus TaxID=2847045 RepID=UPI00266F6CEC|nr:hypothetical protein [Geoalkalibacter halelectricus]MDO3380416.1 hypothetical protein [Geoalkalibacter halelectricus]
MDKASISNKKAAATLLCRDLISSNRKVLCLTAYGPTQEVRAFAHILAMGKDSHLRYFNAEGEDVGSVYQAYTPYSPKLIRMNEGYSGLYVIPDDTSLLIADNEEGCFNIFSRILDQKEFVHRDWYRELFPVLTEKIEPLLGNLACFAFKQAAVKPEIENRVRYGGLKIPAPTAEFTFETEEKHEHT